MATPSVEKNARMPAVVAMLEGAPVPHYIFVENVIVNKSNIDKMYPKK